MRYLAELRINWRYLAAACIGLGSGFGLNQYVAGVFAPYLLQEFGWTKAQFALTGLTIIVSTIALPIAGRLTDRFGVLRMAPFGVLFVPLFYLAYASMDGAFSHFFLINVLQTLLVASTTTSTVYSRLIAENFDRARGIALSLAACAPAAAAFLLVPVLSGFIETHGWRAGYMLLAAGTAVTGVIALLMVPRGPRADRPARVATGAHGFDYRELLRNPVFRIIVAGVLLANLTHMVMAPQLKLILLDHGMNAETASYMLSLFAFGIMMGRLLCGIALDRFPPAHRRDDRARHPRDRYLHPAVGHPDPADPQRGDPDDRPVDGRRVRRDRLSRDALLPARHLQYRLQLDRDHGRDILGDRGRAAQPDARNDRQLRPLPDRRRDRDADRQRAVPAARALSGGGAGRGLNLSRSVRPPVPRRSAHRVSRPAPSRRL